MKRAQYALVIAMVLLVFSACGDRKHRINKEEEIARLESYLQSGARVDTLLKNVVKTSDGIYYVERKVGIGKALSYGDEVGIRFTWSLLDSTILGSNMQDLGPYTIVLGPYSGQQEIRGIEGLHLGLLQMRNGGHATIFVPSTLAYGGNGIPGIPGYTTLRFDVWVTAISKESEF